MLLCLHILLVAPQPSAQLLRNGARKQDAEWAEPVAKLQVERVPREKLHQEQRQKAVDALEKVVEVDKPISEVDEAFADIEDSVGEGLEMKKEKV